MSPPHLTTPAHHPITWPLATFTFNHTPKSTSATHILLDRATSEFGIVTIHPSDGLSTLAQFPDAEPMFFQARAARATCWRSKCKKVCILFEHMQVDLEFVALEAAHAFLHTVEDIAVAAGNAEFISHEVASNVPFVKAEFDMVKHGFVDRASRSWLGGMGEVCDWPRLRQSGAWSDFTIIADGKKFLVHRVRLCQESHYFSAVCSGGYAESIKQSIELPESARVVGTMLDELYETYNSTTGSLFTNFALCSAIEKEQAMTDLLSLYIACDKYTLDKIKRKVSQAFIDRLTFVQDPLTVVDLASEVYRELFPTPDCDLKKALIIQIRSRLPSILADVTAWEEYSSNKTLLKAFHSHECDMREGSDYFTAMTPPATPNKGEKRF